MYDGLVKRLRGHANLVREYNESGKLFDDAADAIEELQQIAAHYEESAHDYFKDVCYYLERVPKWIPVTERLPKDAGVYLCRIKSFSHEFRYTDTMKYVDGFFYEQGAVTDRVTHWMPLPEPPKEE